MQTTPNRPIFGALCLLISFAGCQPAFSASGGLTTATLPDASLGVQATVVTVPAGWRVQGAVTGNQCVNIPSTSWDARSPDGKSQFSVLPTFGWRWGSSAQYGQGCIPLNGPLQAADFLQRFATTIHGVRIVGAMPVADAFRARAENFAERQNGNNAGLVPQLQARNTGDAAAVRAVTSAGNEMRLRAWVECRERQQDGNCFAKVDVLFAPKGQLDALASFVDSHNLVQDHPTQEWMIAYQNRQRDTGNRQMDVLRRNAAAGREAIHSMYVNSSETLAAEHQAGMEQLQSQGQHAMQNANAAMNARSTAASDVVDYALDQQTVSGANGTYKTSSAYSNVWSSPVGPPLSDGRTFGSTDNTVDPNTATDNTWTKDQKVHGNGEPIQH